MIRGMLLAGAMFLSWIAPGTSNAEPKPGSFLSERLTAASPRSAEFLANACASRDSVAVQFCDGYVDGAVLIWKRWEACAASGHDEQAFCAGAKEADERITEFFAACDDCILDGFRPDLGDDEERATLFWRRLQKLPAEMEKHLGACPKDERSQEYFCLGYASRKLNQVAELSAMYIREVMKSSVLGRGDGASDAGLHLYASEDLFEIRTCVGLRTQQSQIRKILLAFLRQNPDLKRAESAVLVLGAALHYALCDVAEGARPHMEACVSWVEKAGEFVAENVCDTALIVQFMSKNRPTTVVSEVAPNEVFDTGLNHREIRSGWWMFTACPAGYEPSVPFEANSAKIKASRYECLPD